MPQVVVEVAQARASGSASRCRLRFARVPISLAAVACRPAGSLSRSDVEAAQPGRAAGGRRGGWPTGRRPEVRAGQDVAQRQHRLDALAHRHNVASSADPNRTALPSRWTQWPAGVWRPEPWRGRTDQARSAARAVMTPSSVGDRGDQRRPGGPRVPSGSAGLRPVPAAADGNRSAGASSGAAVIPRAAQIACWPACRRSAWPRDQNRWRATATEAS